ADADTTVPVGLVTRGRRLGIGRVEHVVLVDVDAARPAELPPLLEELAVLIEDLNAAVAAIADEQTSARIERERVRHVELPRARAGRAELLDELAVLVELEHAAAAAVSLSDEDVAVRCECDVVRLIEVLGVARAAGSPKRHQHLAFRAELDHLMPIRGAGRCTDGAG